MIFFSSPLQPLEIFHKQLHFSIKTNATFLYHLDMPITLLFFASTSMKICCVGINNFRRRRRRRPCSRVHINEWTHYKCLKLQFQHNRLLIMNCGGKTQGPHVVIVQGGGGGGGGNQSSMSRSSTFVLILISTETCSNNAHLNSILYSRIYNIV